MALDVLSSIGSGVIFNYFFDKRADTCEKAAEKIGEAFQGYLRSLISSASSAVMTERIEVLNGLQTLIDNFSLIYSAEMHKTVDKVDKVAGERLAQIDSMVYRLVSGLKNSEMQQYMQEYQALAGAFIVALQNRTLSGAIPTRSILVDTVPKCVAPVKGMTHLSIRCIGFFPGVEDSKLPPILELNGQSFSHVTNGSSVEFSVPSSLLFSDVRGPGVVSFSVRIPYMIPGWFSNTICYSEYKRFLSLLPEFPGKISLEYVTVSMEEKDKKSIGATFWQNSKKGKHGGEHCDIINRPHALSAPSGWKIVPGSGHLHVHCNEGKGNSWSGVTEGPTQVHFHASTHKHHKEKNCGKLGINLAAEVVQYHEVARTTLEDLGLTWGESRALDTSQWKSWKVIFEPFDGPKRDYTGNVNGRYISITSPNGKPIISVKRFEQVSGSSAVPEPVQAKL